MSCATANNSSILLHVERDIEIHIPDLQSTLQKRLLSTDNIRPKPCSSNPPYLSPKIRLPQNPHQNQPLTPSPPTRIMQHNRNPLRTPHRRPPAHPRRKTERIHARHVQLRRRRSDREPRARFVGEPALQFHFDAAGAGCFGERESELVGGAGEVEDADYVV